jgi:formate C-acetyltransferase
MLRSEQDPEARRFLGMIAETAPRVPAHPPRSFYEGLAALWFLREVSATLEAVGISSIGHPDKQLIALYRLDLEAGRLDEQEARDLLARWLLPYDIRFNVRENSWPETSTCMQLGGCDEDGTPVFNELTRMILDLHQELDLLNPKPNCRFSSASPREYLDLISRQVLKGHNVFAVFNDDVLIPALVRHGKRECDARRYVNGGCQETIVEGAEHSAGAYYFFNLPRILDICIAGDPRGALADACPAGAAAALPEPVEDAPDFETFYARILSALTTALTAGARWRKTAASRWHEINPCPFYSAGLDGCIENARDYTAGSARYNDSTISLVGLATMVDSLHAVRVAVFEESWCTLPELRLALAANWDGAGVLRARAIALPKFGHGDAAVDSLATRVSADLAACVRSLENERGSSFQPNLFVYYDFMAMGLATRATPDGRRDGDVLSQGAGPGRIHPPRSLASIGESISRVDFLDHPGNAVIDVQLPIGGDIGPRVLSDAVRTFARLGAPTMQFNCVSVDDLRDAQRYPDRHRDLQVRICGLSGYFVALDRATQDEIIDRSMAGV